MHICLHALPSTHNATGPTQVSSLLGNTTLACRVGCTAGLRPISVFSKCAAPFASNRGEAGEGHAPWVYSKPISCLYVQLPLLSQTELPFATETLARTGNILATECPLCIPPAPHPLLTHTPQPANLGALDKLSGACARCRDGQGLQHTHLQG